MLLALGLLALAFGGDDAPPVPTGSNEVIAFQTRIVEVEGLRWREALNEQLQPVARRGGATVWTADRAIEPLLKEHVFGDPSARLLVTPRVVISPETEARFASGSLQGFGTQVRQVTEGQPESLGVRIDRQIHQGERLVLSGRRLDQGILARVEISDTRVAAVHEVETREEVSRPGQEPTTVESRELVPEVVEDRVAGEWLIPADGLLVVSLGLHTLPAQEGPVVRERLVIIEAGAAPDPAAPVDSVMRTSFEGASLVSPRVPVQVPPLLRAAAVVVEAAAEAISEASTPPQPGTPLPMPNLPSRTLPGDHHDGPETISPDELPALPDTDTDTEAHPASAEEVSAEPRPSPQAKHVRTDLPSPVTEDEDSSVEKPGAAVPAPGPGSSDSTSAVRTYNFRVPVVGTRGIQVRAVVSHSRRPIETK